MKAERAQSTGHLSALFMEVGSSLVALPLSYVIETSRPLPVQRIAHAFAGVLGVAVVRGAPLPVVALGALLGLPDAPVTRFVTLRLGERRAVLAVGAVLGVASLLPQDVQPLPSLLQGAGQAVIDSVGARDRQLLVVLEAMRLVPPDVWALLEETQRSHP